MRRVNIDRFVFLDESGAKTNMKRLYGWAPTAERLVDAVPGGERDRSVHSRVRGQQGSLVVALSYRLELVHQLGTTVGTGVPDADTTILRIMHRQLVGDGLGVQAPPG